MGILIFEDSFITKTEIQSCIVRSPNDDHKEWHLKFTFKNNHGVLIFRDTEQEIQDLFKRVIKEMMQ